MKNKLIAILDTRDALHFINPAHVAQITLSGGEIATDAVVIVELTSGTQIDAIGFGGREDAIDNCAAQLHLDIIAAE